VSAKESSFDLDVVGSKLRAIQKNAKATFELNINTNSQTTEKEKQLQVKAVLNSIKASSRSRETLGQE